jgi:hypothetical protein
MTVADDLLTLPPLILHPFADAAGPNKLVESSRANLMIQGLLPSEFTVLELETRLLEGRYCEVKMLFYIGKDLNRWIEQCMGFLDHRPELQQVGIREESFMNLLVESPPDGVREKLRKWGVADHRSIFSRAFALNTVFAEMPELSTLANGFLKNYFVFADRLFKISQHVVPFEHIASDRFPFEIFASGEYTRMLEQEWEEQA